MRTAATNQEYEVAAKMRDQLDNVRKAIERQQMVSSQREEMDVIGMAEDELEAAFQVFFVRGGRVTGRKGFIVDKVEDLDTPGLISRFLEGLYGEGDVPRQVLVPEDPDYKELLERWLRQKRGGPVGIRTPQRGEKRSLQQTVTENAMEQFMRHRLKRSSDFASRSKQLQELQDHIGMPEAPLRIECFDISNLGPTEAVASMVVFEDGLPKRSDYRRFAMKWTEGPNDVAMMGEVIQRRFARYRDERDGVDRGKKGKFAYPPNLVVIDGGKGQLNKAVEVMSEMGVDDVTTVSLAKRMEEVFVPDRSDPIVIPRGSEALYLLQSIRDEAHRFALAYHRLKRNKAMTKSALDGIPGLGETRRKKLLKHFGSVKKVREASLEDLNAVAGIPQTVAEAIYEALHDRRQAS
jgi:excinuclease ABC subunit C